MPVATGDPPGCCTRLLKRLCRCFGDSSDSESESNPRTGRAELYQYEAPAATSSAGVAQLQHAQRPAAVYEDEADPGGPLLPKTTESSALVPPVRPGHSRNNSSASATAAAAAAAGPGAGGPDSHSHSSLTKRHSGTLGLGEHVLGLPPGSGGPGSVGPRGGGGAHRRTGSQGDVKRQWAAASSGKEHLHQQPAAAAAAAADAHPHPHVHVHAPAAAAAACESPGAPSTAVGRPGAVFGPMQDEDDDFCPTCLEPYTTDNPKIFTECGHHFHMPCIYAWLERKDTCPMCESPMQAPGLM